VLRYRGLGGRSFCGSAAGRIVKAMVIATSPMAAAVMVRLVAPASASARPPMAAPRALAM
jgi:hypothetical protein